MVNSRIYFNREGVFYPYVASFWMSVHGMIDLMSRETVNLIAKPFEQLRPQEQEYINSIDTISLDRYRGAAKTPQLFDVDLQSLTGPSINLDIHELESETLQNCLYLVNSGVNTPLRMLLLACYEASAQDHRDADNTVWEFFRHCRNAAAHDGKFSIREGAITRPASWRGLTINSAFTGKNLLSSQNGATGVLRPADIIRLLSDVEGMFDEGTATLNANG